MNTSITISKVRQNPIKCQKLLTKTSFLELFIILMIILLHLKMVIDTFIKDFFIKSNKYSDANSLIQATPDGYGILVEQPRQPLSAMCSIYSRQASGGIYLTLSRPWVKKSWKIKRKAISKLFLSIMITYKFRLRIRFHITYAMSHKYTLILSHIITMLKTRLEIAFRLIFHDLLILRCERVIVFKNF